MPPTEARDLIAAFDLVQEAARDLMYAVVIEGRIITEGDDGLRQETIRLEAINRVQDFLTNHHEEIEDRFGGDPYLTGRSSLAELDLGALRAAPVDHPLNAAMLITIELAARQCVEEDLTKGLRDALDLVGAFWSRRGAEICSETLSVSIPDGPQ